MVAEDWKREEMKREEMKREELKGQNAGHGLVWSLYIISKSDDEKTLSS